MAVMPRWLYFGICLALTTIIMVGLGMFVAKPLAVQGHAWLTDGLGLHGATFVIFGTILALGIWAYRANSN